MNWRCVCAYRNLEHFEHCSACGRPKPAPPPVKKPTDLPLTEIDKE